jgi:hypothetical protein
LARTTPSPPDDEEDETMSDTTKLFWGNDDHEDENLCDFIKGIERQFALKTNISDMQKLRTFELHLKDSAMANQWWDGLTSTDKDTWDHLVQAFATRWPSKAPMVKTVEEKQAVLEWTTITEEEVGTRMKVKGVEEFAHIVWADKVEWLAAAIPDTNGLLIGAVRKAMPKVLQKVTGTGYMDWVSFCKAICTVTLTQIEEAKEEEKEAQDLHEQVRKLQELCSASTKDTMNTFQRLTVNTPTSLPHFPTLQTQQPSMQSQLP